MDDDVQPALDVHQDGLNVPPAASLDAITTLIHSFASMISAMERRLTERINENALASRDRWARWESDFREYRAATDRRIEVVEVQLENHLAREHDEELVIAARVKPVTTAVQYVGRHWRTIVLILFVALTALGLLSDDLRALFGAAT